MKVLIDLTSLYHNLSGIERYAMCMTQEIIKYDQINYYYLVFKNEIHKDFINIIDNMNNIKAVIIKGDNKLIFNQIKLPLVLYKYKVDVYLFLAFQSPLLFRNKNIYNTIHDLVCWDCPDTMKLMSKIYFRLMIKNALRVSKKIFTISNFTKERIIKKFNYDEKKIVLAYCGVPELFNRFYYNEKKALDVISKYKLPNKYILCLSTLEPRKNIELLINAYKMLLDEKKADFNLVFAGRLGWKINETIQNVLQKIPNRIIFTGFIDDGDLPYIYSLSECFVFPSIYEGFGIPPLEAMTVGTPVICSDAASLPEVVGNAGILFKSNDIADLKEKILLFFNLDNSKKDDIARKGCEKAKLFSWNNESKKIAKSIEINNIEEVNI